MPKLCQIIAITTGRKSTVQKEVTELHQKVMKEALLQGIARTYTPKDENGEKKPPESKRVQVTARSAIDAAAKAWTSLFDVVATQDLANCSAKAHIDVAGKTILADVPVTHLLFLEKQLHDIHTFFDKLPTLDPAFNWAYDKNRGWYCTDPVEQLSTTKLQEPLILHAATKEHPAQVQLVSKDVTVGTWTTIHFSGAIPADQRKAYLDRIEQLQDAVKFAREKANQADVTERTVGKEIFDFILGST